MTISVGRSLISRSASKERINACLLYTSAPLVAISPVALGPCILIMVFCKIIGANIVRIILRLSGKKRSKEGKTA